MTAVGIIIWTVISFVLVASQDTVLRGEEGAVCNFIVTKTETHPIWNCEECETQLWWPRKCGDGKCEKKNRIFTLLEVKQKCCDGYKNKNSMCEPQCLPECEEGQYCAKPNKCECINPGWAGKNCTESLWCVVRVNLTATLSNLAVEVPYTDTSTESNRPECLPQCRDQISNLSVNVSKSTNMTMYFVPVESPCNIEADFQDIPATLPGRNLSTTTSVTIDDSGRN